MRILKQNQTKRKWNIKWERDDISQLISGLFTSRSIQPTETMGFFFFFFFFLGGGRREAWEGMEMWLQST